MREILAGAVFAVATLAGHGQAVAELRARFSFEGVANCQQPYIRNFPIRGDGTGTLSKDRTANLDIDSTVEGRANYRVKLGAAPTEAPAGSASLRVTGRSSLRAVRDYPNNYITIDLKVVGKTCTVKIENRLKPGKRQYTFYNGSGLSYCEKPIITQTSCSAF